MSSRPRAAPSTVASSGDSAGGRARYLMVVGETVMKSIALPASGEIVIGRDDDCDVALPHPKISRRHARVLVGPALQIEDLGSTNGIWVGTVKLERGVPAPLAVGDSVRLGPFTAIVQVRSGAVSTDDGMPRAALTVRDPTTPDVLVERIARAAVNILIQGETGSGKEVLARAVHRVSGRPGELVAINCAALTETLLESELFGHEQGAFTGATRTKPGLLEAAGQGTVLLDEIGDLPLELQGKLLRALEARQIYRVGGVLPVSIEARVIAATHRDLPAAVAAGDFRQDLYFRLNGITLAVSPLRERRGDIALLAAGFLGKTGHLSPAAHAALLAHDWPGNVRELRHVLERAVLLAGAAPIQPAHLLLSPSRTPGDSVDREHFLALARQHHGNSAAIARELSTSRTQIRRLAARFGVDLDAMRK